MVFNTSLVRQCSQPTRLHQRMHVRGKRHGLDRDHVHLGIDAHIIHQLLQPALQLLLCTSVTGLSHHVDTELAPSPDAMLPEQVSNEEQQVAVVNDPPHINVSATAIPKAIPNSVLDATHAHTHTHTQARTDSSPS